MFLALNTPFRLRRWKGLPPCLCTPAAIESVRYLSDDEFELLRLADGETDIDPASLTTPQALALLVNLENGTIVERDRPAPIASEQRYRSIPTTYVHGVYWSISGDCNLRCRHCYMSGGRNRYRDLARDQYFELIRQFDECGVMDVELSGGEPQLNPWLWNIVDELLRRGMVVSHFHTNGTLLTEEFFAQMRARDVSWTFDISLDGVGTHDHLRGTAGAEAEAVAAMRAVKRHGHPLHMTTKLHQGSVRATMETYELAKSLNADVWRVSLVFPVGEAVEHVEGAPALLCDEYLQMLERYREDGNPFNLHLLEGVVKGYVDGSFSFWGDGADDEALGKSLSCSYCRSRPYVLPDGTLEPCIGWTSNVAEADMPNLLETPLAQAYADPACAFRQYTDIKAADIVDRDPACKTCEYRRRCGGGCRADAYATHPGSDARYERGLMMCGVFKSGFMEKCRKICQTNEGNDLKGAAR